MAGTMTFTETERDRNPAQIKVAWVSATGGNADGTTTYQYTGALIDFVAIHDGTDPSTGYDVTIKDANGADILNGLGANIVSSAEWHKTYKDGLGAVVNSKLTVDITNAGETKDAVFLLTIAR